MSPKNSFMGSLMKQMQSEVRSEMHHLYEEASEKKKQWTIWRIESSPYIQDRMIEMENYLHAKRSKYDHIKNIREFKETQVELLTQALERMRQEARDQDPSYFLFSWKRSYPAWKSGTTLARSNITFPRVSASKCPS